MLKRIRKPARSGAWPRRQRANSRVRSRFPSRGRRGATALEYVIVASLILVAVIVTVQQLGLTTSKLFSNNANATAPKP